MGGVVRGEVRGSDPQPPWVPSGRRGRARRSLPGSAPAAPSSSSRARVLARCPRKGPGPAGQALAAPGRGSGAGRRPAGARVGRGEPGWSPREGSCRAWPRTGARAWPPGRRRGWGCSAERGREPMSRAQLGTQRGVVRGEGLRRRPSRPQTHAAPCLRLPLHRPLLSLTCSCLEQPRGGEGLLWGWER